MKQAGLSTDVILEHLVRLTADLIDTLTPLIEKTQPHRGMFGGTLEQLKSFQTAKALLTRVEALRRLYY